jgi:hypothetical protein
LQHCNAKEQIVTPELIPALFEIAVNQKSLRPLITACCGKRGEWLSSFNREWNFYVHESDEAIWQNGTAEQRKRLLQQLRETDPAKGRDWLQQTWSAENANTKAELLKQLENNISPDDTAWLETVLEEKSQKVKEVALRLLKRIPASSVVNSYWNILHNSVVLKKEKALLGTINKTSLQIQLTGLDEAIFKTGIEKLSNTKSFTDEEFVVYQLIEATPPQNWEASFNSTPEQIILYFQKEKSTQSIYRHLQPQPFNSLTSNGQPAFLQDGDELFFSGLIFILPEQQQDEYSIKYLKKNLILLFIWHKKNNSMEC